MRLPKIVASLCLAALLAAPATAQNCSTLAITSTSTNITFDVTGATASSLTMIVIGETAGSTVINLGPFGTLTLGLDVPFIPLPLGVTNAQGGLSRQIPVPSGTPSADLFGQALTIGITFGGRPTLSFCTSNVVGFHIGS